MTPSIEAAQAFIEQTKDLGRDAFKALYAALTHDVKKVYRQLSKAEFFTPERARTAARTEYLSPSGKYKLVVTPFETSQGTWAYTQGLVFAIGQDVGSVRVTGSDQVSRLQERQALGGQVLRAFGYCHAGSGQIREGANSCP